MNKEARGSLVDSLRPWVSLAITIHFFAIVVSLAANLSPSELQRRLLKVLTPYTVGLHQNYQGVPLEMTRGNELDRPCALEVRRAAAEGAGWQTIAPPKHFGSALDQRWGTFVRTAGIIANEQNDPLVHLLLEQCVRREDASTSAPVDSVRLVRRPALSYAADQAYVAGELPQSENETRTLFECRVVRLDGGRIRLVPVLEPLRTSKSLAHRDKEGDGSPTPPTADNEAVESKSSERQP